MNAYAPVTQDVDALFQKTKGQLFYKNSAGFLGRLLAQVSFEWMSSPDMPTAAISTKTLYWNPEFFLSLTPSTRVTVLAHELWHNGALHGPRMGNRCPDKWNAHLQKGKHSEWYPTKNQLVEHLCKISAARCARISYKPFDGDASYERELDRYDMLVKADRVHASPLEHQATPDRFDPDYPNTNTWESPGLHGNFSGWIQARKLVPNEAY